MRSLTLLLFPSEVTRALAASNHARANVARVERVEDLSGKTPIIWEVVIEEGGKRRELVFKNSALSEKEK